MSTDPSLAEGDDAPNAGDAGTDDQSHVPSGTDYVSDRAFADFPISSEVLNGISELGYVTATPVQAATIEAATAGRDMLVRAKTGTGKTAAFCVPIVERATAGKRKPDAIILAPTRELAQQIGDECGGIAKFKDVNLAVLVGGVAMGPQEKQLAEGAEIIVGTPGRVLDHVRRKNLDLSEATMACLDEADEMLSMGFYEDVVKILDHTKEGRQVLLFSATISDETQRLANTYLKEPEDIRLSTDADNDDNHAHVLYETTAGLHKIRALLYVIDIEDPASAIIFCNTRDDTATVASFLDRQGLDVQLLSGELSQNRRSQVMSKVKAGEVRFLVSTDVAARGIDISDLSHVINYSLPQDPAVYLHRTGRTGRIGKQGTAISLVGGPDLTTRNTLENRHDIAFEVRELPDADSAVQRRVDRQARQIRDAMGSLVFESYLPTVAALKERPDGDRLLAAALRAFFQWDRQRRAEMGEVDSIGSIIQQRNEKLERKAKRDKERDRGERRSKRPNKRSRKPSPPSTDELEELDALLVSDDSEGSDTPEAPAKKKRKRKKKPVVEDDLDAMLIPADEPSDGEGAKRGSSNKTDDGPDDALDDFDALLTAE